LLWINRLGRAGDRTRTGDVQLGKLAFYQLNYAREIVLKSCAGFIIAP
jgi:hypothetical protein